MALSISSKFYSQSEMPADPIAITTLLKTYSQSGQPVPTFEAILLPP